jgi:hypothetical protein
VTVPTALHYFDLENFYTAVKHVLRKPGGVIAAWSYGRFYVTPEVDKVVEEWHRLLRPYWAPGAELAVEDQYRTIPFLFEPVGAQAGNGKVEAEFLQMQKQMTLDDYLVLWDSQSFVHLARDQGVHVLNEDAVESLRKAWGVMEARTVTWPISLLVGTVASVPAN